MDISDIIFGYAFSSSTKRAIFELIEAHAISDRNMKVIMPTAANDDINGSQHASGGGNDFTYEDVSEEDVREATTFGYYEYFSEYYGIYTGHYYNGSDAKFAAIVIDPPAYAVEITI